jgi:hypothetical protein
MQSLRVFLQGGLGNQLFTYFAAAEFAIRYSRKVKIDTSELPFGISNRSFGLQNISLPVTYTVNDKRIFKVMGLSRKYIRFRRIIMRRFPQMIFESKVVGYDPKLFHNTKIAFLKGYFQSWRHYDFVKNQSNMAPIDLKYKSEDYLECLRKLKEEDPICIHVRRGDYLKVSDQFGILSEDYFKEAIAMLKLSSTVKSVWLFSDEPSLVLAEYTNLKIDYSPLLEFNLTDEESLFIMANASNLVISNSSFSWWAATLGNSNKSVIYPNPWYRTIPTPADLCPSDWIAIASSWKD